MKTIFKSGIIILIILITAILFLSYKKVFFLEKYANFFVINDAKKNADLILILSGNILTRGPHAFELLRNGYSKRIMITNRLWHKLPFGLTYPSDIEMANSIKKVLKISEELEILKSMKSNGAASTFDEANDFLAYLKKNKNDIKRVILVTDESHSRRALLAFKKTISPHVQINFEVSSVTNNVYNPKNWWKSDIGLKTYINEFFLLMYYKINSGDSKSIKNF